MDSTNAVGFQGSLISLTDMSPTTGPPSYYVPALSHRSRVQRHLEPPELPLAAQAYLHRRAGDEELIGDNVEAELGNHRRGTLSTPSGSPSESSWETWPIRLLPPS